MEMKQQLRMAQQLVMTPQLQQAIKLLQLSRMELIDSIRDEMLENPILVEEGMDESPSQAAEQADAPADGPAPPSAEKPADLVSQPDEVAAAVQGTDGVVDASPSDTGTKDPAGDIDWENYLDTYQSPAPGPSIRRSADDLPSIEQTLTKTPGLTDHLTWQLRMSRMDEVEEAIAMVVIHNLDDYGYLKDVTVEEIGEQVEEPPEKVEAVLKRVQEFDPVGVAARDLRECLLLQAAVHYPQDEDLSTVIRDHLSNLERKNYQAIVREIKQPLEEVIEIAKIVASMEPRPGRMYTGQDTHYVSPDIHVLKVGDEYITVLNEDGLPKLKVSDYYRRSLAGSGNKDTKEYINEKLRSAVWIIRSIHQRQRTILKVTESIVKFQREFLDKGIAYLKPLILRDVADDIGMHESTVSRVTTNKYVHTPQGLFELKYFFNSGIRRYGEDDIASEAVKDKIKHIVSAENTRKPYSDQQIVRILAEQDIHIARRTVAKYREMLGILPSSKRKSLF